MCPLFKPAQYSVYSKILHLSTELKSLKHARIIHGNVITNGFLQNVCFNTRLVIIYSKFNRMKNARKVFDQMLERNVVTWTALISGYSRNGDHEEALRVFSAMHWQGVTANQFTYGSALSACAQLHSLQRGKQIQGRVHKGRFVGNLFVQSALVDLYSKCGEMEDARCIFDSMEMRDLVSWNALIAGYAAQGLSRDVFLLFRGMLREGMVPDSFSFGSILRSFDGLEGLAKLKCIHGYLLIFGFGANRFLVGSLVDAYVECRSLDNAKHVYNSMQNKDVVSCTALIKGYAREDYTEAFRLFNEAQAYVTIDGIILSSMLSICAKIPCSSVGRQLHATVLKRRNWSDLAVCNALIDMYSKSGVIEDAKLIFDEMEERNIISWTSLITAYGRHGYGHEAVALCRKMEDEGLQPNDVTFLSLLFACSHSGLTAQGWECFSCMVSVHKILPRAKHYACLVDLVARGGHMEEVYDMIGKMPDASILGAILGACTTHDEMSIGQMVAKRLLDLQPDSATNYVALSGVYASVGMWNWVKKMRMLMGKKKTLKCPGHSVCESNM